MSETIAQQIMHHLSTLPHHVRQRRTAVLLRSALSAIEDLTSALRELHDFAVTDPHYRHVDRSTNAFQSAAELLKEMEERDE